jgi:hypothetical protein
VGHALGDADRRRSRRSQLSKCCTGSEVRRLVEWRTGSERRISYLKRRCGWDRTLFDTMAGRRPGAGSACWPTTPSRSLIWSRPAGPPPAPALGPVDQPSRRRRTQPRPGLRPTPGSTTQPDPHSGRSGTPGRRLPPRRTTPSEAQIARSGNTAAPRAPARTTTRPPSHSQPAQAFRDQGSLADRPVGGADRAGQQITAGEVGIYAGRGRPSLGERPDHQRRTAADVPGGENAVDAGHEVFVAGDQAALVERHAQVGEQPRRARAPGTRGCSPRTGGSRLPRGRRRSGRSPGRSATACPGRVAHAAGAGCRCGSPTGPAAGARCPGSRRRCRRHRQ